MDMINFTQELDKAIINLNEKGAFLTVKSGDEINTMTIGWGNIGYQWKRPTFMVMVRKVRHTYDLIDKVDNFTVTIPLDDNLKKELTFCGVKSGRDYDKFKECSLNLKPANKVDTPVIDRPNVLTYECKIVYKQEMEKDLLIDEIKDSCYRDNNYHVLYYGEIVDCYKL